MRQTNLKLSNHLRTRHLNAGQVVAFTLDLACSSLSLNIFQKLLGFFWIKRGRCLDEQRPQTPHLTSHLPFIAEANKQCPDPYLPHFITAIGRATATSSFL